MTENTRSMRRKRNKEELVEIAKKHNVVGIAYLSEILPKQNFLVCVKIS